MQQNQPQPEFGQDHIVRRLISKFRKPSDASAIGVPASLSASNTLQVPGSGQSGSSSQAPGHHDGVTLSAAELVKSGSSDGETGSSGQITAPQVATVPRFPTKQSRWSALVASAAAGAASKPQTSAAGSTEKSHGSGDTDAPKASESGGSNRSSMDRDPRGPGDEDLSDSYLRSGGRGHSSILDSMERR